MCWDKQDKGVIPHVAGGEENKTYPNSIATGVSFILAAVNAIAAPMFASLYAQEDYEGLQPS